jgi:hypothetical protein
VNIGARFIIVNYFKIGSYMKQNLLHTNILPTLLPGQFI